MKEIQAKTRKGKMIAMSSKNEMKKLKKKYKLIFSNSEFKFICINLR